MRIVRECALGPQDPIENGRTDNVVSNVREELAGLHSCRDRALVSCRMHRCHEFEGVPGLGIKEGSRVWLADDLEPHMTKVANQFL